MKCEKCEGLGYNINVYVDTPCPKCSPASDEFQARIIAAYLREALDLHDEDSDSMSDKEIIACHGGERQNRIIASDFNGRHLYRSIGDGITVFAIIDPNGEQQSFEAFVVPDPKRYGDIMDSTDETLPCLSNGWEKDVEGKV